MYASYRYIIIILYYGIITKLILSLKMKWLFSLNHWYKWKVCVVYNEIIIMDNFFSQY
jgi:hypothetical protein